MQPPKPYRDERPWGEELWLSRDSGTPAMVKVITVNPGEALSLQYHHKRDEFWQIISGDGRAEVGPSGQAAAEGSLAETALKPGTTVFVPRETRHRVIGGRERLVFIELSFGDFDEADIVRLADKYGRTAPHAS